MQKHLVTLILKMLSILDRLFNNENFHSFYRQNWFGEFLACWTVGIVMQTCLPPSQISASFPPVGELDAISSLVPGAQDVIEPLSFLLRRLLSFFKKRF